MVSWRTARAGAAALSRIKPRVGRGASARSLRTGVLSRINPSVGAGASAPFLRAGFAASVTVATLVIVDVAVTVLEENCQQPIWVSKCGRLTFWLV